jgi:hypothetical protein
VDVGGEIAILPLSDGRGHDAERIQVIALIEGHRFGFGDALRSKTRRAQINEALCKVLCHNICCLISAMHELNLKPKFYEAA